MTPEQLQAAYERGSRSVGKLPDEVWGALVDRRHAAGLAAAARLAEAEALRGALPAGARWFPVEGGIQWQGKLYFPADYVMSRTDIAALSAEVARQQAERDAQIADEQGHLWSGSGATAAFRVADKIRAQFEASHA